MPDTIELADIGDLRPHPRNPRQGDIGEIAEMIASTGWHTVVTVQRKGRGRDTVIAGWHRTQALAWLAENGYTDPQTGERLTYEELARQVQLPPKGKVPVEPLRINDRLALKKLLQDNRANDLADYDWPELTALLRELAETADLDGTGYTGDDLDELIREAERDAPLTGDQTSEQIIAQWAVVIECTNETEQRELLAEMQQRGLNVRALVR